MLYPPAFQAELLSELSLADDPTLSKGLDAATDGLLIHADNFQALQLLQTRYREQVKCIYIDPPYNTDNDGFIYKDNYQHSSWSCFLKSRLELARGVQEKESICFISIDENETAILRMLASNVDSHSKAHAVDLIWNTQHSQQSGLFSPYHEYIQVYTSIPSNKFGNFEGGKGEIIAGAIKKISSANPASNFTFPAGVRFDGYEGQELKLMWGDVETVELIDGRFICENGKLKFPVTLRAGWTQKNQMTQFYNQEHPVFDTKGQRVIDFFFYQHREIKNYKRAKQNNTKKYLARIWNSFSIY